MLPGRMRVEVAVPGKPTPPGCVRPDDTGANLDPAPHGPAFQQLDGQRYAHVRLSRTWPYVAPGQGLDVIVDHSDDSPHRPESQMTTHYSSPLRGLTCSTMRRLGVLLITLNVAACTTWRPATAPLPAVVEEEALSRILVTRTDGREIEVQNPAIVGDTLYARKYGEMPVAMVATGEVQTVEVRDGSAGAAALVFAVAVVGSLALVIARACQNGDGGMIC